MPFSKNTFSVQDIGRSCQCGYSADFGVVNLLGDMVVFPHECRMAAVCRPEAGLFVTQLFAAGAHPSCVSSAAARTNTTESC